MRVLICMPRGMVVAGAFALALAQAQAQSGIYTCTDAKGRKLTSDRQIGRAHV